MIEKYAGTLTGMFARKVLQKGRENAKLRALVDTQAQKIAELSEQNLTAEEIHAKHTTQRLLEEKQLSEWTIAEIDRGLRKVFWKNSRIKGDVYIYDALILRAMAFEEKIAEQAKEIERLKL